MRNWDLGDSHTQSDASAPRLIENDHAVLSPDTPLSFRTYMLFPRARVLLRDRVPVEIGSRALDLLHVLAAARGEIVSKQEIIRAVWPTTVVEEGNLRFQIAVLRRLLAADGDLIRTIPGRGYLLAVDLPDLAQCGAGPGSGGSVFVAADDLVVRLAESAEAREALRTMFRAVLNELWDMTYQERVSILTSQPAEVHFAV